MNESITYVKGDATKPIGDGPKIVAHIVNSIGVWGAGFVLAVSRRWPKTEAEYRNWWSTKKGFALGNVQFVEVEPGVFVANMIAQRGIRTIRETTPIRYDSLQDCLAKVADKALELGASVHGPRFGAGLAGGKWETIEKILEEAVVSRGILVTIYDL